MRALRRGGARRPPPLLPVLLRLPPRGRLPSSNAGPAGGLPSPASSPRSRSDATYDPFSGRGAVNVMGSARERGPSVTDMNWTPPRRGHGVTGEGEAPTSLEGMVSPIPANYRLIGRSQRVQNRRQRVGGTDSAAGARASTARSNGRSPVGVRAASWGLGRGQLARVRDNPNGRVVQPRICVGSIPRGGRA